MKKNIGDMSINEMKSEATAELKKRGFSEQQIQQIADNLEALSMHLTILDTAMRSLPLDVLDTLNKAGARALAKGERLDTERHNRLGTLIEMAKEYQHEYGTTEDTPAPNVFGGNGQAVMA